MINFKLTIDVDEVLRLLSQDMDRIRADIAERIADEVVIPKLAQSPAPSHRAQKFVSAKQRRFFFAALRKGQIVVPYRRTGALSGSWGKQPFGGGVAVRSSADYAELVMGVGGKQATYHRGTWPTLDQVAQSVETEAALTATAVLVEKFRGG